MWRLKVTADAGEVYTALREAFEQKYITEETVPGTGGREFRSMQATLEEPGGPGTRTIAPTTVATTEPGVSEQFRCVQKALQTMLQVMDGEVTVTCSGEPGEKLSLQLEVK